MAGFAGAMGAGAAAVGFALAPPLAFGPVWDHDGAEIARTATIATPLKSLFMPLFLYGSSGLDDTLRALALLWDGS